MPAKSPFALLYDPKVALHLKTIDRKYYSLIRRTIEKQLSYEPETETRNRKPLRRPSVFGPDNRFRVFYRTDQPSREVHILALGIKIGNRLFISEEEFEL